MKAEYETAYDRWSNLFERTAREGEGPVIERAKRGANLIDRVMDNVCPSYADKNEFMDCISVCIRAGTIKRSGEIDVDAVIEKHRVRLDELVPMIPMDEDERDKLAGKVKECIDRVNADKSLSQQGRQALLGFLSNFVKTITSRLTNASDKRKFTKACKLNGRFPEFRKPKSVSADPRLLHVLADILRSIPSIFHDRFLLRTVENVCLDYTFQLISHNLLPDDVAIGLTLSAMKDMQPELMVRVEKLFRDIQKTEKAIYDVVEKRTDNMFSLFQLEATYRVIDSPHSFSFIFDEAGTRKTITAAVSMILRLRQDGIRKAQILVVCSNGARDHWVRELNHRLRSDVAVAQDVHVKMLRGEDIPENNSVPYEFLIVGSPLFSNRDPQMIQAFPACIVDECHNYKKRDKAEASKRSDNIIEYIFLNNIEYRQMLTATPVVNDISEYINMVSLFSGKPQWIEDLKALPDFLEKGAYIHGLTSDLMIRRRKSSILGLSPLVINRIDINIGERGLKEAELIDPHSLAEIAVFEARYKIPIALKTFRRFANSKGLVFSNYIMGDDGESEGILKRYYLQAPKGRGKIYISGEEIIDLEGNCMPYNVDNANAVRKQFLASKKPAIAFVSVRTCRESINEFRCVDFIFHAILPYEAASWDQANARGHRDGRDKNKDCVVIVPIVRYRTDSGKPLFDAKNRQLESFDEGCMRLIESKTDILNACCDGVKRTIEGELLEWSHENDKPFASVIASWVAGMQKIHRGNKGLILTNVMSEIQHIDQNNISAIEEALARGNKTLEESNPKTGGLFADMETVAPAKASNKCLTKNATSLLEGKDNTIIYVGCGASKVSAKVKSLGNVYMVDKYYEEEGVICCDRSEIAEHCPKAQMVYAGNVMHWNAKVIPLSETMMAYNEALEIDGYCLMISPEVWVLPFAENKTYLKSIGFELVDSGADGAVNYYLLRKVKEHKKSKYMRKKDLPQKID